MRWIPAACSALVLTFASAFAADASLTVKGDDDSSAAEQIIEFLQENGIKVKEMKGKDGKVAAFSTKVQLNWICQPVMTVEQIDRIVFTAYLTVDDAHKGSDDLALKVSQVNAKYNIGKCYVDSDGDLVVQGYMTFNDRITAESFRRYQEWLDGGVLNAIKSEGLIDLLK